jgi:hypothetical protein
LIWLVEIILRGWMASSDWARYLLIFMSPLMPEHPFRTANQLSLLAMTALFAGRISRTAAPSEALPPRGSR